MPVLVSIPAAGACGRRVDDGRGGGRRDILVIDRTKLKATSYENV
jgi:hypothetical protein